MAGDFVKIEIGLAILRLLGCEVRDGLGEDSGTLIK
jgi:hypothetical protein